MNIKLSDIFILKSDKSDYSKKELLALELKKDFINKIAKRLDLIYLENSEKEGNLCFMNNEQLRPEFKVFFSKSDIIGYLSFTLKATNFGIKTDKIPFPEIIDFA
jgi:hypothetical protein